MTWRLGEVASKATQWASSGSSSSSGSDIEGDTTVDSFDNTRTSVLQLTDTTYRRVDAAASAIHPSAPLNFHLLATAPVENQNPHHRNATSSSATQSYWNYASNTLQQAAESTYSGVSGLIANLYQDNKDNSTIQNRPDSWFGTQYPWNTSSQPTGAANNLTGDPYTNDVPANNNNYKNSSIFNVAKLTNWVFPPRAGSFRKAENYDTTSGRALPIPGAASNPRRGTYSTPDLTGMLLDNPYNSVRGRRHSKRNSMSAVRSLLTLVPNNKNIIQNSIPTSSIVDTSTAPLHTLHETSESRDNTTLSLTIPQANEDSSDLPSLQQSWSEYDLTPVHDIPSSKRTNCDPSTPPLTQSRHKTAVSDAETASQVAEGTIRALRDMALDEAVELQASLRFWTDRWEQPVLSWIEAGPYVWTSRAGYNHQAVGRKVSQIQAVLARRCAAIGELQQHLLKAGWQRGVAQWGVLGQGGQWAAVAGFDAERNVLPSEGEPQDVKGDRQPAGRMEPPEREPLYRHMSSDITDVVHEPSHSSTGNSASSLPNISVVDANHVGIDMNTHSISQHGKSRRDRQHSTKKVMANVMVQKRDGGGIFVDDPSILAEWSVEAIALTRRQLFRAANGQLPLPFDSNWIKDQYEEGGTRVISQPATSARHHPLPLWASAELASGGTAEMSSLQSGSIEGQAANPTPKKPAQIAITNLPLMVNEVTKLLDVMEDAMEIQRWRRLDRLRPPSWLRRNWYMVAALVPTCSLFFSQVVRKGYTKGLVQGIIRSVSSFVKERLRDPIRAIFNELLKGRENFSDSKARAEAVETLKKMIESWLEDYHPHMSPEERRAMAEAMDVTMVEKTKEESMKTFYEINNVIRMSFIEMQYMKKEMMNALNAMDEMMSANDINMNLAAITPVFLVSYFSTRIFKFMYYALLKLGKSREETFASFRDILTDIDRLLVMRDNPPPPAGHSESELASHVAPCVLGRDDLGMLMLLIHECRTIMWRDRHRFQPKVIANVSEDLDEIAGERGAVSVRQQLQIVARMSRTYPFLKVISTGHDFHYSQLRMVG